MWISNILWVLFSGCCHILLTNTLLLFALFNCFFFYSLLGFLYILVLCLIIWIGYSLFLLILNIDLRFDVSIICLRNCCVDCKCDFLGSFFLGGGGFFFFACNSCYCSNKTINKWLRFYTYIYFFSFVWGWFDWKLKWKEMIL